MTPPDAPDPATPRDGRPRARRLNRSRAIAAGTSVGALVVLTAGVAVANPGTHSSPPSNTAGTSGSVRTPAAGDGADGGDTGWLTPDGGGRASNASPDPGSGWTSNAPDAGSGTFDPGAGGGTTRSGGS